MTARLTPASDAAPPLPLPGQRARHGCWLRICAAPPIPWRNTSSNVAADQAATNLTAGELATAWKENKAKVKAEYFGKTILVSGITHSVDKSKGRHYLYLQDESLNSPTEQYSLWFFFSDDALVTNIKPG